ncbi:APC amino acid permease [Mycena sanguinolenta]|uniref:APC amino acid permease n=1 Tax=Mycena sanguinolenta TaxID=230812 RepID=A0A8H6ZGB6_9AGAR|nr:APC amino acid permease [Mycena sanguinolenta]
MSDSVHQETKATMAADEAELARMGYKQELRRELGLMQNFGVSFSIISVITGIPSLFLTLEASISISAELVSCRVIGPAVMVWGWVVVSVFTMLVGLAMAGLRKIYFKNDNLLKSNLVPTQLPEVLISGPRCCPNRKTRPWLRGSLVDILPSDIVPSFIADLGWFNLLGQVAGTTGISFACATFLSTACTLKTDFCSYFAHNHRHLRSCAGTINTFGVEILHYLNNVSVWWHAIVLQGTFSLVVAMLAKAPTHQSGTFVFKTFLDGTSADPTDGWGVRASHAYVVVTGILMAQYTLTGFDASAHMTEETKNAAMSGSIGIIMAIGVSAIMGWFLILGLLFSIQDLETTLQSGTGQPVTQIFLDTVGENGAIVLMVIVIGAMFFCGTFNITSNSRMMFAFARDGGIPGHKFFNYVNAKWKSPIRTGTLLVARMFLELLSWAPSLGSSVAFSAATSIATIGLFISYAIPIALRVVYRDKFVRGPFHLGAFSYPVALTAVVWMAFISIAFILPQVNPVTSQTFNYSVVAVGIVIVYSVGFWLLSARKWFTGPVKQIAAEEMGINVMEPAEALKFAEQEKTKQTES